MRWPSSYFTNKYNIIKTISIVFTVWVLFLFIAISVFLITSLFGKNMVFLSLVPIIAMLAIAHYRYNNGLLFLELAYSYLFLFNIAIFYGLFFGVKIQRIDTNFVNTTNEWLLENIEGRWLFCESSNKFFFQNKGDAMAFKIAFGEHLNRT